MKAVLENARLHVRVVVVLGLLVSLTCQIPVTYGAPPVPRPAATALPVAAEDQLEGYIRVIQGDTLDARQAGARIGIGIIGVKAPSLNAPCGRQAAALTQELVSDGVRLVEEPGLTFDRRKRRMYHVMTLDGLSIAEELVSAGLARADGQGTNRDMLAELEAGARDARRGCLWGGAGQP